MCRKVIVSRAARCWSSWTISALAMLALAGLRQSVAGALRLPRLRQEPVLGRRGDGKAEGGRRLPARPRPGLRRAAGAVAGAPRRAGLGRDLSALRRPTAGTGRAQHDRRRGRTRARRARASQGAARPARPLARRQARGRGRSLLETEADERLLSFDFPADHIHGDVIRSKGFTANHLSVYDLSAAAKRAIWDRTDRLIERSIAAQPT